MSPAPIRCTVDGGIRLRRGLSLVEVLVVLAILAVLMSIMLATLGRVRLATRAFVCKNKLQDVVQQFALFADEYGHEYRGRDSAALGANRFRIEDFQESLYRIDEFYDGPTGLGAALAMDQRQEPLMCPAGPRELGRRPGKLSGSQSAITPKQNVSVAFNMRLYVATRLIGGRVVPAPVTLTPRVLDRPWAPLVFDVDGAYAQNVLRRDPFFSAPAAGEVRGLYAGDRFWFPSLRHGKKLHAGFIGGHVWTSADPAEAVGWDWQYQPPPDP